MEEKQTERQAEQSGKEEGRRKQQSPSVSGRQDGMPREHHHVFYGDSREVGAIRDRDLNEFMRQTDRKQSMTGFDADYRDFVDYITKITYRIWEEKGIGYIYKSFHNGVVMHHGSSSSKGIASIVSRNLQTLHAFPDRKLIGGNVIWSGNDREGFYSSHRMLSTATNTGASSFGPATYRKIAYMTIVDTFVVANRIVEGWLIRDNLHMLRQLGLDPHEIARKLAPKSTSEQPHFGLPEAMDGQLEPPLFQPLHTGFDIGDFMLAMYNAIWEWKLFNRIAEFYADNAVVHFICDKHLTGYDQIQGMWISLLASFPNAKFIVERVTCNRRESADDWDVAVRWRLQGVHEGVGYFGRPSGKPADVFGISNLRVYREKIVEEWLVIDGLDVLKQIYAGESPPESRPSAEDGSAAPRRNG